jgi:hypothetical protein
MPSGMSFDSVPTEQGEEEVIYVGLVSRSPPKCLVISDTNLRFFCTIDSSKPEPKPDISPSDGINFPDTLLLQWHAHSSVMEVKSLASGDQAGRRFSQDKEMLA